MALAFAKVADSENVEGKLRSVIFDVTLDTSYPAGGTAIPAASVGLRTILGARHIGGNPGSAVILCYWDTTNSKLMCLFPTGGKAASAPTSLGDPITTSGASMASAVDATRPTLVPGQAQEVGATADIHALVVRIQFFGV